MRPGAALVSGLVGACTLTAVHETARHTLARAPRVNVIGERVVGRAARALRVSAPDRDQRYLLSLAGELASNAIFYSLVGFAGRRALAAGAGLGLVGGAGAAVLPGPLGLGRRPVRETGATTAMTVTWYTLGGIAAGAAYRRLTGVG